VIDVTDFGAVADYQNPGSRGTDNKTAFQNAINAAAADGDVLILPEGSYYLGVAGLNETLLDLSAKRNLQIVGYGARLVCETASASDSQTAFLGSTNPDGLVIHGLRFHDLGSSISVTWLGAAAVRLTAAASTAYTGRVNIQDCELERGLSLLRVQGHGTGVPRISDMSVIDCVVRNAYYGINTYNNGDRLRVVGLRCYDVRRAYINYGASDHQVDYSHDCTATFIGSNASSIVSTDVLDVSGIRIQALLTGTARYHNAVLLQHDRREPIVSPRIVQDVTVNITMRLTPSTFSATPLRFISYLDGMVESTTLCRWDRIHLSGDFGPWTPVNDVTDDAVMIDSTQQTEGELSFAPTIGSWLNTLWPQYRGFSLRTALNREVRTARGDLSASPIHLSVAHLDARGFTMRLRIFAHDRYDSLSVQKSTYREDVLIGYNAGGSGGVAVQSVTNLHLVFISQAVGVSYTAVGDSIRVDFSGYTHSNGFARVEVESMRSC
jgi:hypothetical protein